ncbi:MAG: outer membrane beta-barrel protein [Bryobacteraceae bacterium]
MRRISRYLPPLFVLFCGIQLASAQSAFDLNLGFGAIQDKASSTQVDQALNPCTTSGGYVPVLPCVSTPSLSGFMMGFGGDLMLWKKFGIGGEVALQPAKETYINLNASAAASGLNTLAVQSRMTLFDFNGIFEPVNTKKVGVKLAGGVGGANLKFYESGSSSSVLGSQNMSQYFASANHFQVHGGVGVQIYLTNNIFVRPQFDIHYVPNLTQFGSNLVTTEMVWLGYSWGDR